MPTRAGAAWLRARVLGHVVRRALIDRFSVPVPRHPAQATQAGWPVVAERRTPLWQDGRVDEFVLVAGKVQNLRVARAAFDGIVVPAGAPLSFWRQLGRPTRGRGFVQGREIRAGCVVPVVAGGLCQLSNALARCALDAGLTLLERHGHTARVEQAGPEAWEIDATVSWNYVDLRLAAPFDWQLEVELTADELVVRVRAARGTVSAAATARPAIPLAPQRAPTPVARSCLTCDETRCHRHPGAPAPAVRGRTAVLVDAWSPEFAQHLRGRDADWFVPWLRPARRASGAWLPPGVAAHAVARVASWRRTWWLRRASGEGSGRQLALMRGQRALAVAFARALQPHHTHLMVDQGLLLPLERLGALQGRRYEVLMGGLPIDELQRRLDAACARWPRSASLHDYRAPSSDGDAQARALRRASALVTAHADVAAHLRAWSPVPVIELAWTTPPTAQRAPRAVPSTPLVVLPASALARKGAHELAEALRELRWRLRVLGTPSPDATLWQGIEVEHAGWRDASWLQRADVVALPAWVEHAPRALLLARAHGLPVVATRACGLPASAGVREVEPGDVAALVAALRRAVAEQSLTRA